MCRSRSSYDCTSMPSWRIFLINAHTLSLSGAENESSIVVTPCRGMSACSTSKPNSTMSVVIVAAIYMPVPHANPMAAVTHSPAAVVSPRTTFFWKMMVPAPRKLIPDLTYGSGSEESDARHHLRRHSRRVLQVETESVLRHNAKQRAAQCHEKVCAESRLLHSVLTLYANRPAKQQRES